MKALKIAIFGLAAIAALNLAIAVLPMTPGSAAHHADQAFSIPASAELFVGL